MAAGPTTQQAGGNIAVGKDTTYLTKPAGAAEAVDYQAAVNAEFGAGVTAENNAAGPLLEALGVEKLGAAYREVLVEKLGLKTPPGQKTFEAFDDFARHEGMAIEQAGKMLAEASRRPWKTQQFPLVARWLSENDAPLGKIAAASWRPRCFVPWLAADDGLSLQENAPYLAAPSSLLLAAGQALACRGNLRLGDGRFDDAWGDAQAIFRLGQLWGQSPTYPQQQAAAEVFGLAERTAYSWAAGGAITPPQCRKVLDYLAARSAPNLLAPWRQVQRLLELDLWVRTAQDGRAYRFQQRAVGMFDIGDVSQRVDFVLAAVEGPQAAAIDYTGVLRLINRRCDEVAAAVSQPTFRQRRQALTDLATQYDKRRKAVAKLWQQSEAALASRPVASQPAKPATSQPTIHPALRPAPPATAEQLFLASNDAVADAVAAVEQEADVEARHHLAVLAVALALCRAETGKLPEHLADLSPKYLPAVPVDPFGGGDLIYRRTAEGFIVYSVGSNLRDDGGQDEARTADDVSVRFPPVFTESRSKAKEPLDLGL